MPGGQGVFHTEEWRERQTPMYLPVTENLLINTANIEQLSFTAGSWFLADETGNYCGSQEGKGLVINCRDGGGLQNGKIAGVRPAIFPFCSLFL